MKITVYTTSDCQFSKQELEYLKSHNLQYEEKNLEINKEFLTEMLAVGDNFSGTPVTRIEKDDGQSVVLKGFTKEEFDQALGFAPAEKQAGPETPAGEPPKIETATPVPSPTNQQPNPPTIIESPSIPTSIGPPPETPQPPTSTQPPAPVISPPEISTTLGTPPTPMPNEPEVKKEPDQKLTSVLDNLQSMSGEPASPLTDPNAPKPPPSNMPSIPDPNFS